jgi:predicted RNA-binding protein YlqC (UPF0109 family)
MSRPRDVVEVIGRALVDHPDAVNVREREHAGSVRVELRTAPGDFGKLIGRQGRTATAVRTLAQVAAGEAGPRVTVDFLDDRPEE